MEDGAHPLFWHDTKTVRLPARGAASKNIEG